MIAVDGLRASAIGAYGNAWYETPALDAFASESHVVDWMWCDSPSNEAFYRAALYGRPHSSESALVVSSPVATPSLAALLGQAGILASLTTDDAAVAEASDFPEVCQVETQASRSAASIEETTLSQLFAVAAEQLQASKPGLFWLHARGFHGPWDAPMAMRAALLDEEDPPPTEFVAPPSLAPIAEQDEALAYRAAYAAQAMVLDDCVAGLLAALAESPRDGDTLVVVVGTRGFALGEHGVVGVDSRNLYSELLHVPCLLRLPQTEAPPARSSSLAMPIDLFATLLNWFGVALPADFRPVVDLLTCEYGSAPPIGRQWIAAHGVDGELAVRTAAWMLRRAPASRDGGPPGVELYAKPDDRWEANEISDRCPDVAERLLAAIEPSVDGSLAPLDADLALAFR